LLRKIVPRYVGNVALRTSVRVTPLHISGAATLTAVWVALVFGLVFPASAAPLPEGNNGIAAHYPGDVGIDSDPAVVFADDFESYGNVVSLMRRWNGVRHFGSLRIASEPGHSYSGSKALEITVPKQSVEASNSLTKHLDPKLGALFLRYYAKFDAGFDVIGSSHNGSTISASYCCPGVRADGFNKFFVSLEAWRGEASAPSPGHLNIYIYHPDQRDVWGDHFFPTGRVVPFDRRPGDFGPEFVARPDVVPVPGRWYCYELMVKANTPGRRDGRVAVWLDGRLTADFPNLRLRETDALAIDQFTIDLHVRSNTLAVARKWYDNVVAATSYIGPMVPLAR
jgi:hypothetical protein